MWYFADLRHFLSEQVRETQDTSRIIISEFSRYTVYSALFSLPGVIMLFLTRQGTAGLWLIASSLILPMVHLVTNSSKAIYQHSFLVLVFLLPVVGYFFAKLLEKKSLMRYGIVFIVVVVLFIHAQGQVRRLEKSWQNTGDVMAYLKNATTNHERLLSSEGDVTVLALSNLKAENITGPYTFEYKNKTGSDAYRLALGEDYFDFVLLNDHDHQEVEKTARDALTNHYKQVYNKTPFVVYSRDRE